MLALAASCACAQTPSLRLSELTLEELGNIEVTSVSRRAERLSDAPASVFVITAEDIRRSGATSLPEALRLAPNLQVARLSAAFHAVTSRGFNSNTANKLLVLIDGRSVYTPLFGGVFWDAQQLPLQDVERIEVISGPGGTLWGVNAVNGVINVITRPATQTRGFELAAGAGNREHGLSLRQGLDLGGDADRPLRLWARHVRYERTHTAAGESAGDAGHVEQIGARTDWDSGLSRAMLQAQAYLGQREAPIPGAVEIPGAPIQVGSTRFSGGHVLARWERQLGHNQSLTVQGYYDRTERRLGFRDTLDTLDLQLQHALQAGARHAVVWGAELRQDTDNFTGPDLVMRPARLRQVSYSLFAQDEITLREDLRLTLGARAERNAYTGVEYLPSARLAWHPAPSQLVWGALSRTVRGPTRLDRDVFNPGRPPSAQAPGGILPVSGNPDFLSEVARVAELGWRGQPGPGISASATVYQAQYERLRSLQLSGSELVFANGLDGRIRGVELWGSWQLRPNWRLHGGFNRTWQDLHASPGYADAGNVSFAEGSTPARQWMLRSQLDLPRRTEFDLTLRGVSALADPAVPAYVALDLRLGWRPRPGLEWSLAVQNALGGGHGEFGQLRTRSEIGRSVFLQLVLQHDAL
ncbi:TonB-dependent receptor plug domain-containing protein [Azohydromonas caseinilytica]|uniref:TonB-dependent receptor plug domain-containing protein n=1 Tax=Azohydromonas caseinilytica TaxID=2728836 RepID=UPI0028735539|nr:TonB-dependent receptor [Azohydromonas caseinilytica]